MTAASAVTRSAVALAWLAIACGPRVGPGAVTSDDAIVYLRSNVRDAQVFIDGKFVAPLNALAGGFAIEPGTHRVELRHEDYFSSYLELRLARAERKQIELDMAVMLP